MASAIQSTWRSIGSITRQTRAGGASISIETLMRPTAVGQAPAGAATPRSSAAACSGGIDVDQHAGATLEAGLRDQVGPDVDVPVVLALVCVRSGVEADVVGHVADQHVEEGSGVTQRPADRGERLVVAVLQVQLVAARDDQHLVRRSAPVRADDGDVVVGERRPARRWPARPRPWCTASSGRRTGRRRALRRAPRRARTAGRATGREDATAMPRPRGRG